MADITAQVKSPRFLVKIVELILAIVTTGVISGIVLLGTDGIKCQIVISTVIGYLIIDILVLASYIVDGKLNKIVELMITISGAILHLTSAAFMFELYDVTGQRLTGRLIGGGIVALVKMLVYGGDAVLVFFTSAS